MFTPDFAAADAGFPLYEKGMYRLKVTKRSAFCYEKEDKGKSLILAGVHYGFEMFGRLNGDGEVESTDADGKEIRGKPVSRNSLYVHNRDGWGFSKQFLMAACGFSKNEENEANAELFQTGDWVVPDDPTLSEDGLEEALGESWDLPVNRFVDVFLQRDSRTKDGVTYEDQKMSAWQPVGERAV